MRELKITSFICHAGLQARRNGVCDPYDLDAVLRSFDADVIVVQESWTPDAGASAVRQFGESVGAEVFELRLVGPDSNRGPTFLATATAWATWGWRS